MLGGTYFVGPRLVQAALDRGHEVTLFNRGRTNPHLFPELEKLRGNRFPERGRGLQALEGERRWDAALDTWQGAPGCIDLTARMLADRTDRYLYTSSIAAYRGYQQIGMTEEAPLLDASGHLTSLDTEIGYSMRKAAGEQILAKIYGNRAIRLRCGSIQASSGTGCEASRPGPGYWGYRFLLGEPLLVPDDETAAFQLIDVRDVAEFAIRAIEEKFGGACNLVGPEEPLLLEEYARAWNRVTKDQSEIVWVDPEWLLEQGVRPFDDIRNWIPGDVGFYRISNQKAQDHGLTFRPLEDTIRDHISCATDAAELEAPTVGMERERELALIER